MAVIRDSSVGAGGSVIVSTEGRGIGQKGRSVMIVHVVGFQHKVQGEGVGGFDWFFTREDAEVAEAERERTGFYGPEYEHAIFPMEVPDGLSNDEVTRLLDADYIDALCAAVGGYGEAAS